MNIRTPLAALMTAAALIVTSGCAVTRGQETTGAYVDDASITTSVKAKMVEDKNVDREEHGRDNRHACQGREDGQEPDRDSPLTRFQPVRRLIAALAATPPDRRKTAGRFRFLRVATRRRGRGEGRPGP